MKECMERWYLFTGQRCSIRKYQSSPSSRDIFELLRIAEQLSTDEFRIVIKKNKSVFVPIFLNYGKVSGTGLYAANRIPRRSFRIGVLRYGLWYLLVGRFI